jgi:hypothetical protein
VAGVSRGGIRWGGEKAYKHFARSPFSALHYFPGRLLISSLLSMQAFDQPLCICFFFFLLAQTGFKLGSCLSLLSVEVIGSYHHAWLCVYIPSGLYSGY